jgi:copper(I)-binding protein
MKCLPPGGVLDLAPGGKHFMLMGPVGPLGADDVIELQLDCGEAGQTTLRLPVRRTL